MKILIVGYGFVGKAVEAGFKKDGNTIKVIDPAHNTNTVDEMIPWEPDFAFLCLPTPENKNGSCDYSILLTMFEEINNKLSSTQMIVKSTVTPDGVQKLLDISDQFVYEPEFLIASNAIEDFLHPKFHILGGDEQRCESVARLYDSHSNCSSAVVQIVSHKTASVAKYGINCFLALKVAWYNELYDVVESVDEDISWDQLIRTIQLDTRQGKSHMMVPGFDGERGFGGACFPKDTKALEKYAASCKTKMPILKKAIQENEKRR